METIQNYYKELNEEFSLSVKSLHTEQLRVLQLLLEGNNVLAVLPTGSGKSMLYAIFPLLKMKVILIITKYYQLLLLHVKIVL
jgi:ATP-dependent DNA helicase RecQ